LVEIAFIVLGLLGWWWYSGTVAREAAILAAGHACQRHGLQLLDETVSVQQIRMRRDRSGRVRLWRSFLFEFTDDGDRRRSGHLELLGRKVLAMHLDLPDGGLYEAD
jgi:hypothetical protein